MTRQAGKQAGHLLVGLSTLSRARLLPLQHHLLDVFPPRFPTPVRFHARGTAKSPMCGAGDYMFFCEATSAAVCGVCANGTATERASYTCETCVSGYFALAGSEECSPCPAGKYGTGDGGVVEETACRYDDARAEEKRESVC